MGHKMKTFYDGSYLEYDRGSFDEWCVYLIKADGKRYPPTDTEYFSQLKQLANQYGVERIYADFVQVYALAGKKAKQAEFKQITELTGAYGADALEVDTVFSILYMAMIAEECKANTRLGKRIKRLGVHKLLLEDMPVADAANFMRGMKWREIDALCKVRGF